MGDPFNRLLLEGLGVSQNAMKKVAAAIAGLLIASPAVHAGETWVMGAWQMSGPPKPGTIAEDYDWHGLGFYIDLQSVVRRGDLVFYYDAWIPLDGNRRPIQVLGWDKSQNKPERKNLRIANCKTLQSKSNETANFKRVDPAYRPVIHLACDQ